MCNFCTCFWLGISARLLGVLLSSTLQFSVNFYLPLILPKMVLRIFMHRKVAKKELFLQNLKTLLGAKTGTEIYASTDVSSLC